MIMILRGRSRLSTNSSSVTQGTSFLSGCLRPRNPPSWRWCGYRPPPYSRCAPCSAQGSGPSPPAQSSPTLAFDMRLVPFDSSFQSGFRQFITPPRHRLGVAVRMRRALNRNAIFSSASGNCSSSLLAPSANRLPSGDRVEKRRARPTIFGAHAAQYARIRCGPIHRRQLRHIRIEPGQITESALGSACRTALSTTAPMPRFTNALRHVQKPKPAPDSAPPFAVTRRRPSATPSAAKNGRASASQDARRLQSARVPSHLQTRSWPSPVSPSTMLWPMKCRYVILVLAQLLLQVKQRRFLQPFHDQLLLTGQDSQSHPSRPNHARCTSIAG